MEKQIKHFRHIAFRLIAMAEAIKCSAETTLAYRSVQMGRGWLGQALKPYGPTPYMPADNVEDIPETVDTEPASAHFLEDPGVWGFDFAKEAWVFRGHLSTLDKVNFAREACQNMVDSLSGNMPQPEGQRKCFENAIQHFQEAKMWYGYQLAAMRASVPDNATEVPVPQDPPEAPTKEEVVEADKLFEASAAPAKKSRKAKK